MPYSCYAKTNQCQKQRLDVLATCYMYSRSYQTVCNYCSSKTTTLCVEGPHNSKESKLFVSVAKLSV